MTNDTNALLFLDYVQAPTHPTSGMLVAAVEAGAKGNAEEIANIYRAMIFACKAGDSWRFTDKDIQVNARPQTGRRGAGGGAPLVGIGVAHRKTGAYVSVTHEDTQHKNRQKAFIGLNAILAAIEA